MPLLRIHAGRVPFDGVQWLFRQVAQWSRKLECRYLSDPGLRRALKAIVDFSCAALSVVAAIAVAEGVAAIGMAETAFLALAAGCFLVAAEALGGSYRTMWRYVSFHEAVVVAIETVGDDRPEGNARGHGGRDQVRRQLGLGPKRRIRLAAGEAPRLVRPKARVSGATLTSSRPLAWTQRRTSSQRGWSNAT